MARVACYTQLTTRGHELRRLRDDAFIRMATPEEVSESDAAGDRDGGIGAFEAEDMSTVRIPARQYEDHDDCLAAAAVDYAREHGLEGWDLAPRWEDNSRETILLTVPPAV